MATVTWSKKRTGLVTVCQGCPERPYVELEIPGNMMEISSVSLMTISNDQGFSDHDHLRGSYDMSFSYFNFAVRMPNGHYRVPPVIFQHNRHAVSTPFCHRHVWSVSESGASEPPTPSEKQAWIRAIQPGDTITIIPQAKFLAWRNFVHEAEIQVSGRVLSWKRTMADKPEKPKPRPTQESDIFVPLDSTKREIRLIELQPGIGDEPVCCKLLHSTLGSSVQQPYEALSYCWESTSPSQGGFSVIVHNEDASQAAFELPITANLHAALQHLRRASGASRTLWIDAICINQSDLRERAHQVATMRDIFTDATAVVVWLGIGSSETKNSLRFAEKIVEHYQSAEPSEADRDTLVTVVDEDGKAHDSWAANGCLILGNEWFRRAWVVQEVYYAKSVTGQLGAHTVPWPLLLRTNMCVDIITGAPWQEGRPLMPAIFLRLFDSIQYSRDPYGKMYANPKMLDALDILDVFMRSLDLDATDPRDKVFAILGLANRLEPQLADKLVRPDYRKDPIRVFADFTRWHIIRHHSLRILSAVHATVGRTWQVLSPEAVDAPELGRPSWSFWHEGRSNWAKATLGLAESNRYCAAGTTEIDMDLIWPPKEPMVLSLRGLAIGEIHTITTFPYISRQRDVMPELFRAYDILFDLTNEHSIWTFKAGSHRRFEDTKTAYEDGRHVNDHLYAHLEFAQKTGGIECHPPSFFRTSQGHLGLCPPMAREGDLVVVLCGACVPYILRKKEIYAASEDEEEKIISQYQLVGECYVEGYMHGLAVEALGNGHDGKGGQVFELV